MSPFFLAWLFDILAASHIRLNGPVSSTTACYPCCRIKLLPMSPVAHTSDLLPQSFWGRMEVGVERGSARYLFFAALSPSGSLLSHCIRALHFARTAANFTIDSVWC